MTLEPGGEPVARRAFRRRIALASLLIVFATTAGVMIAASNARRHGRPVDWAVFALVILGANAVIFVVGAAIVWQASRRPGGAFSPSPLLAVDRSTRRAVVQAARRGEAADD